eukprot:756537-Hanusia_phi.AAC.3
MGSVNLGSSISSQKEVDILSSGQGRVHPCSGYYQLSKLPDCPSTSSSSSSSSSSTISSSLSIRLPPS